MEKWINKPNYPKKQKHHDRCEINKVSPHAGELKELVKSMKIFSLMLKIQGAKWTSSDDSFKQQREHIKHGTDKARQSRGSKCCHSQVNRIHLKRKWSITLGVRKLLNEHFFFQRRWYKLHMHYNKSNQWLSHIKSRGHIQGLEDRSNLNKRSNLKIDLETAKGQWFTHYHFLLTRNLFSPGVIQLSERLRRIYRYTQSHSKPNPSLQTSL